MTSSRRALLAGACASALAGRPVRAQEGPVGPCSPFHAADGDIPSEMPGCGRRLRPAPGSLADELDFARRRRAGAEAGPDEVDEPAPVRRRPRHRE